MKRIVAFVSAIIVVLITSMGCQQPVDILLKQELFVDPEVNNGSEYINAYNGQVVYANNRELRRIPADDIIIPQVKNPSTIDIYNNCLYYTEDNSNILYSIDFIDSKKTVIRSDCRAMLLTAYKGLFVVADERIYYYDVDGHLCSVDLTGDNKKVISTNTGYNLAYRKGEIFYINLQNEKLYKIKTDGNGELCIINDRVDYYFLTEDTIIYQTGYYPNEINETQPEVRKNYYFKKLIEDNNPEILLQGELDKGDIYSNSKRDIQLIYADKEAIYFTEYDFLDKKKEILFKYHDSKKDELTTIDLNTIVFPAVMIEEWIYFFGSDQEKKGFFRIHKDGKQVEKIGDDYQTPRYMLE